MSTAAGPDGLTGCVLRACSDQLASVFTDIFNLSLTESVLPTCFDQTTIVPVPKEAKVTCLNDYRHVAFSHLDKRYTYVRMLFIDYSSVFNTIAPSKIIPKPRILGLNTSLHNWILD